MDSEGDSSLHRRNEEGTQSSHRMLGFSDALLSIIATVMILPVTHTEISPEQVTGTVWFVQWASKKTRPGLGEPTPKSVGSRAQGRTSVLPQRRICIQSGGAELKQRLWQRRFYF